MALGTPTRRGVAFGPNLRVTDEQSDESVNNRHAQGSYGDYAGLVAFGGVAYPVWCDARLSNFPPDSELREEIYTSRVPYASSLLADSIGSTAANETLTTEQVEPLLTEAVARWQRTGADVSALTNLDIRITDLPGATLSLASGNTIWLDVNAAGWGWFLDPTPWDDFEFTTPGDQGEQNRMDLLTAMAHELGHLLGYDHDTDGVMAETLSAGVRRVPGTAEAAEDMPVLDLYFGERRALADSLAGDLLRALAGIHQQHSRRS
jgi:hypothetical protein